jgi:hypothetical protein
MSGLRLKVEQFGAGQFEAEQPWLNARRRIGFTPCRKFIAGAEDGRF